MLTPKISHYLKKDILKTKLLSCNKNPHFLNGSEGFFFEVCFVYIGDMRMFVCVDSCRALEIWG